MNLYLLRHGEAEVRAASDSLRQLTPRGIEDVHMVARQFATKGVVLERCFVSPYLRAQQTANEFLRELHQEPLREECKLLSPEVGAVDVMAFLQNLQESHILLVGHNPLLSELASLLTEGRIGELHILGTAELVCIALDIVGLGMGVTPYRLLPSDAAWHD
ncbi:MAG TPA: phosphohistidine phosphatase SixA [Hyphomicrobiales bacterium]|nr:phosphohistidine phosphatase SixA [Hyphomicrobiales bacterium]